MLFMTSWRFRGILLCSLMVAGLSSNQASADDQPLSRISFGACAKQDQPQPIWDAVVAGKPELFIFLGDNIYGDSKDMNVLKGKYDLLAAQPGFQALKKTCPVIATWDDHDFGADDSGADFAMRKESQQLFLDFWGAARDDERRTREGIYSSAVYGRAGQRVQIILLDARYFRSPLKKGFDAREPGEGFRGKYIPNDDDGATVLGEAQWKWLAEQLKIPAEVRIIGSSYQVLSNQHGWEMWGNFPKERERLFRTFRDSHAGRIILLSGDRHLAEMATLPTTDPLSIGYPVYEITSSSLNAPSGNMTKAGVRFANEINPYRVGLTFFDVNYGNILIDWTKDDPVIRMQVCDEKGGVVLQQRVSLSELQAK
ncbi:MAG TPA: alkaline phosphatase D family protein [Planctomycetaceae bacterium]|nr:alkaline phosphatase D family protein [Planctomycetaceae bacterium]